MTAASSARRAHQTGRGRALARRLRAAPACIAHVTWSITPASLRSFHYNIRCDYVVGTGPGLQKQLVTRPGRGCRLVTRPGRGCCPERAQTPCNLEAIVNTIQLEIQLNRSYQNIFQTRLRPSPLCSLLSELGWSPSGQTGPESGSGLLLLEWEWD